MKHCLFLNLFLICFASFGQNMIQNGGFEGSLSQWQNLSGGGGVASFSLETSDVRSGSGAMKVQVTAPGTNAWDVQSIHSGWASAANTTYTLTFWAKAIGNPSRIRVVQQNSTYAARDFDLTINWTQFSWTFTAGEANLQLKIHYFQTGNFLLDDFEIINPATPSAPRTITVSPNTSHQTMVGFGGALTWHADRITRSSKKNEMVQLLFEDLGTDIVRLKSWYYPLNYPTVKTTETMEVDWFKPHFTATNELASLAKQYNPNMDILLSSWGPPSSLKSNNDLEEGTLKKNNGQFMYNEYGQYWKDILDNISFNPDYISIQNEPGFENPGWTTTGWRPTETTDYPGYGQGFDAVYNKISTRNYVPKMIGPETENIGSAIWDNSLNTYRSMASVVKDKEHLYAYAYHLYNFGSPGSINNSLLNMVRDEFNNKPNFMTEFSSDNFDWLQTGHMIQLNLMEANTSAYIYWEMMWDQDSRKALIAVDNSGNYTISPYYYTMKHFAKFIDKGDKRVSVAGSSPTLKVTGFLNPENTRLTMVISNINTIKDSVHFQLGALNVTSTQAYRSTSASFYNALSNVNVREAMEIPAQSLTTLVLNLDGSVTSVENYSVHTSTAAIELFPVPASEVIYIKNNKSELTNWTLLNLQGQILSEGTTDKVNISNLQSGIYFIKVGEYMTRFIKN